METNLTNQYVNNLNTQMPITQMSMSNSQIQDTKTTMGAGPQAAMGAGNISAAPVQENLVIKKAEDIKENPYQILAYTGASWIGLWGLTRWLNKKIAGEYDKSFLGKISNFGDKTSEKFGKTKFAQFFTKNKNEFKKSYNNFSEKSPFLSSFEAPTTPRNKLALGQLNLLKDQMLNDSINIIEKSIEKKSATLADFGLTEKSFASIKKNPLKNADKVLKAFEKVTAEKGLDAYVKIDKIPRKCRYSEYVNKLKAVTKQGGKTKLGKNLTKSSLNVIEGMTNGMAGSVLFILMQAYIIGNALKLTKEAPKGEKMSTFMENMCQDLAFYLSIPAQMKILHAVGGLSHIGMGKTKTEIKARADIMTRYIKIMNEKAKAGSLTQAQRATAQLKIDGMLNGLNNKQIKEITDNLAANKITQREAKKLLKGNLKWYQRIFQRTGRFISTNLRTLDPIKETGKNAGIKNFAKGTGKFFRRLPGGAMRFVILMIVIAPFFGKIGAKTAHLIFGRPTKSVLDKEPKEPSKPKEPVLISPEEEDQLVQLFKQQQVPLEQVDLLLNQANLNEKQKINIKNKLAGIPPQSKPQMQQSGSQTQVNTPLVNKYDPNNMANKIADPSAKDAEPVRTYIPSPVSTIEDNQKLTAEQEKIFQKMDYYEQQAQKLVDKN